MRLLDGFDQDTSVETVFRRAGDADPDAIGAAAAFAREIADGVAALALAIDPEVMVVAGDAVLAGDAFLEPPRRAPGSRCLSVPRVEWSSLGTRAVAAGALARSLDHVRDAVLELPRG